MNDCSRDNERPLVAEFHVVERDKTEMPNLTGLGTRTMDLFAMVSTLRSALQTVGRIIRFHRILHCSTPLDQLVFLRRAEPGVSVNDQVRRERHFIASNLIDDILEAPVLFHQPIRRVLIKIQSPFSIADMLSQEPARRLNLGVPWIRRTVAVAVVTGSLQDRLYTWRNIELRGDVVR